MGTSNKPWCPLGVKDDPRFIDTANIYEAFYLHKTNSLLNLRLPLPQGGASLLYFT